MPSSQSFRYGIQTSKSERGKMKNSRDINTETKQNSGHVVEYLTILEFVCAHMRLLVPNQEQEINFHELAT